MAQRAACFGNRGELTLELPLLGAQESDLAREPSRVPAIRDHDLELTCVVPTDPADDAELEQQELNVMRETLAVGRVRDLDRSPGEQRRRPVSVEEGLHERALECAARAPDGFGNALLVRLSDDVS